MSTCCCMNLSLPIPPRECLHRVSLPPVSPSLLPAWTALGPGYGYRYTSIVTYRSVSKQSYHSAPSFRTDICHSSPRVAAVSSRVYAQDTQRVYPVCLNIQYSASEYTIYDSHSTRPLFTRHPPILIDTLKRRALRVF